MTELEKAESLLLALSRDEKLRLLERLVRDLGASFPGIAATPGVAGGEACIVRTRIPVWTLVRARALGLSADEILRSYSGSYPKISSTPGSTTMSTATRSSARSKRMNSDAPTVTEYGESHPRLLVKGKFRRDLETM